MVKDVITNIVRKESFEGCKGCPNKAKCDVERNMRQLQSKLLQERLNEIFNRVYLAGYHATLRDLQSFFSYLLLGDRDCENITRTNGRDKYTVTELIYSGNGALFDKVRETLDPIDISHPQLDESLLSNTLPADSWDKAYKHSAEATDPTALERFRILKRHFYFFNTNGKALIDISNDDGSRFNKFLELDERSQLKEIVGRINQFFGGVKDNKRFRVWQGHRYDFSPRRILFSVESMEYNAFEIVVPRLSADMSRGIAFTRSFVLFKRKDTKVSLKIDFEFYSMLLQVESGIPMLYMDNDMVKRMWFFIEQLIGTEVRSDNNEVEISLYDVQTKRSLTVEIDLDDKRYAGIKR
jgi:hypothetical protein